MARRCRDDMTWGEFLQVFSSVRVLLGRLGAVSFGQVVDDFWMHSDQRRIE
jgi:hypothetical protein